MKKWLGFFALVPGLAMIFLDQTILPVALPTIQKELGAADLYLQWSVNAYLLVIAMFVLVGGKLSDRVGHQKICLLGIICFAFSSALCGLSANIGILIGARALQGVGASLLIPSQTALLNLIVPASERGRMIGLNVSISSIFLMLGPVIGGYLTEMLSWRWIFWVNLPIAVIGLILIKLYLPNPKPGHEKIDIWGFIYFALGCWSLVTALMQGRDWGWLSAKTGILLVFSTVNWLLLIRREKRSRYPFLDLGLFKHSAFASINVSISVIQFILMITVFRAIYFQENLGYSPSQAGLLTFFSTAPVLFLAPVGGYLSDKISPKLPIAIGYVSLILSFFGFGFFSTPHFMELMICLLLFGIGIPLIFTPSYSSAMGSVPPQKIGVAFGMVATLRNFAATLGLALISLVIHIVEKHRLPSYSRSEAQIAAFSVVHFVLGFLLIGAFATAFVLYRRKSTHHLPKSPAEGWD
ncbi:MAG TPA: MFS transporter [Rhabdochlamydiaceae bacterium]|nr:MFS transporter [Rhabdochlamydiaceae bacterium]